MIILLGTSHISPKSIEKIREGIGEERPGCVAVELDFTRYQSMLLKRGSSPPGIFLKFISWMQRKLGKTTGIFPGQEMFEAVEFSRGKNIPVYLIDQEFQTTLRDIQDISIWEKIKLFVLTIFSGYEGGNIDLEKVPPEKMVKEAIDFVREKFPEIYKTLVEKRNKHMALALRDLDRRYEKVFGVVGAGHVEGLKKLLKDKNPKIIPW